MFYFGSSTYKGAHDWLYLSTISKAPHTASERYHRLNEQKCSSYISVAYVDAGVRYYISDYDPWGGMQMTENVIAGSLYSIYKENNVDKIYRNEGSIPHFSTTTVNKTVGTTNSEIAATAANSIYGNKQVLYYYYTRDGGTTFTKFDPSNISSLAVGVYTVYALGWDGHILVRSDYPVTLNVGVPISLDANGGTNGKVTSVFATSGIAASTGNIAAASLPTKTGYTFNGFWTSGGMEVINKNGEWKTNVSGYTDNSGKWICSAASTLYAHWTPKTYNIRLEGMEADGGNVPIDVVVTYDAVLPALEQKHTKEHYEFLGYWADKDDKGATLVEQLIDKEGNWIKNISPYTGANGDNATWIYPNIKSLFAKWKEIKYTVNVAVSPADAGSVQVGGVAITKIENVGYAAQSHSPVLTAVPSNAEWWVFKEWSVSDDKKLHLNEEYPKDGEKMDIYASGEGQTLTANFVERWALSAQFDGWGQEEFSIANVSIVADKAIGYVDIALPANRNLQFKMVDKLTGYDYKNGSDKVYYMTNGNSYKWSFATEKAHNCGITTAGAGTYRFMWNITDKTMSVIYPNFVIYRSGDQDEDSESATHTITSPVESYAGGTISEAIEFRMKVRELDKWYSLSLPFEVNKVCVWDNVDGAYYDIVPYYRPTLGGTFYTGHYIIRKPVTTTDFAIEGFEGRDRWIDPESPTGYLPSKDIPYIIQWHDSYFLNKYISFFGDTNQDIPSDFNAGYEPSADDVVNIFGNKTMKSGTVRDAYLLDKDYGPSGAWLREDIGRDRTILPFECFILANTATTTRYRILRRGMEETDTPTALEQISNHQSPMTIRVYTITGVLIGEYNDCSFQDAAHRIATDHNEGIYILRSENESMKLLLGGK